MMEKYISDDRVALCLSGLRFVQKGDSRYSGMPQSYTLSWEYKGSKGSAHYEDKKSRDAMYDKIQEALTKGPAK